MNVKILVATHKKYQMPDDPMYVPIHVGAEGKNLELGYIKDSTGENISRKNSSFCELTGLYWAWKNVKADYIGLAHYRRHFSLSKKSDRPFDNVLTSEEVSRLFQRYKVVLPRKRRYYIETLYSHYAHTHYVEHLDITRKIIQDEYPDYLGSFDRVMKQTSGYMFNMMILPKHLMDDYCLWLFSILFTLENKIDQPELSTFQGRFYGRVSEIIFNVWLDYKLEMNVLKKSDIYEANCIYMEKIDWNRKIISFIKAKLLHKRYEGSF